MTNNNNKRRMALGDITSRHGESSVAVNERRKRPCNDAQAVDARSALAMGGEIEHLDGTAGHHHHHHHHHPHQTEDSDELVSRRKSLEGSESAHLCRCQVCSSPLSSQEKPCSSDSHAGVGSVEKSFDALLLSCGEAIEQPAFDTPSAHVQSPSTTTTSPLPPGVIDIDDLEGGLEITAQRLNPYGREYHTYLRERENVKKERPRADYLEKVQKDVVQDMRTMLVDWLISVTSECELMPSTLYHCVDLVDRSLSRLMVQKEELQCLGCACLFIACKFEETSVPRLEEFTYMAAESFTKKQMVNLETRICESLKFRVSTINTYNFLPRFTKAAGSRTKETALVHYLCELMLLHYEFLAFKPSVRAAAALYLARKTLAKGGCQASVWTPTIEFYTGYAIEEITPCVRTLHRAHVGADWLNYEALRTKYSQSGAVHVADVPCLDEKELLFGCQRSRAS